MGERRRWMDELEPVRRERERAKERRAGDERVDRRAQVVDEARERQLARPDAAARLLGGLEDLDLEPLARELDRGGEPVGARADDDRIGSQATPASAEVRASRTISRAITRRWISWVPS